MSGKTIRVGRLQLSWHYTNNPAIEREWGACFVPGLRWRAAILLGRLTAWVGAR